MDVEQRARELLAAEIEKIEGYKLAAQIRAKLVAQIRAGSQLGPIMAVCHAAIIAALAARQPVYEGHTWISDYVLAGLRERAALPLQLRNGEVWHWQGDGHDFPESLACPVIMSAEALRALLAARPPVGAFDEAAVLRRAAAVLDMWEDDPNLTGYMGDFNDACGILELLAQHAAPPAQAVDMGAMPDGWRLSKKATCYQLSHGNDIIGNLVGPDAEENAAIIARVLDSQAVGK